MKLLAAALTTALLVFAIATAISETLSTPQAPIESDSARHRIVPRARTAAKTSPPPLSHSRRRQNEASATKSAGEASTVEIQESLREVQDRERSLETRQAALDLVFEEIRNEQQSVEQLRQQLNAELATLRDASVRLAQRDREMRGARSAVVSNSRFTQNEISPKTFLLLPDAQSVDDSARLIGRLAKDGGVQSALMLLMKMKERDAAKVLTALDKTDSRVATALGERLLESRLDGATRR